MKIDKLNVSVVVLARDHNPSILHPSFLSSRDVVPEDWELAEPPLCTPPLSIVKYKNGIVFTVESNKFQVLQSPPTQQLRDSEVPQLALRYIERLPHVRYTAVGVNMAVALRHSEPERFLIERFLASDNCNVDGLRLKAVALRFVYPVDDGVLNLSCNPGMEEQVEQEKDVEQISGVVVNANYHSELVGDDPVQEVKDAIATFAGRCDHFERTVLAGVFSLEMTD